MFAVEIYAAVRQFVLVQGNSRREAARVFGVSRDTVAKMCAYSAPPGYRRSRPPTRPKLDPFVPIIDAILAADKNAPRKQRHTARRIFERLRDEHGFTGGITIVTDYVREARQRTAEKFVPLSHPPGGIVTLARGSRETARSRHASRCSSHGITPLHSCRSELSHCSA